MRPSGYCTSELEGHGPPGRVGATGGRHPSCYRPSLALGAALLLLALVLPVAAETPSPLQGARTIVDRVPQGYTLMAQSSNLELHMDPQTAQFAVRDRRSGRVWLSSPDFPDPDARSGWDRQDQQPPSDGRRTWLLEGCLDRWKAERDDWIHGFRG